MTDQQLLRVVESGGVTRRRQAYSGADTAHVKRLVNRGLLRVRPASHGKPWPVELTGAGRTALHGGRSRG